MGDVCAETAGAWWWFPVLLLGFGAAVMAVAMLLLLGDGWVPDDEREDADEDVVVTRWPKLRSWLPRLAFPAVTVYLVIRMANDEGWASVGELASGLAVLTAGVVGLGFGFARLLPVANARASVLVSGRTLDAEMARRVSRARWGVGAVLVVSAMVFVVMLGLYGGTMVDITCPE